MQFWLMVIAIVLISMWTGISPSEFFTNILYVILAIAAWWAFWGIMHLLDKILCPDTRPTIAQMMELRGFVKPDQDVELIDEKEKAGDDPIEDDKPDYRNY